jgi:uncharacterized membrane protein YczE
LLLIGSAFIAGSVAITLWNDLGPGPLDVFIGAIQRRTGMPLTFAVWATVGSMLAVAWVLGRRPGVGSILSPLAIGPVLQGVLAALETIEAPQSLLVRLVFQLFAVAGIGLGAGALIVSGLGAGSGELLASAASDKSGRPETWVRMATEFIWVAVGLALGGPAGIGTIVVAIGVGPAVAYGYKIVDGAVEFSRRRIGTVSRTLQAAAPA